MDLNCWSCYSAPLWPHGTLGSPHAFLCLISHRMRILLPFLISFFLLTSCSLPGTQTETTSEGNTALIDAKTFSVRVPKTWTPAASSSLPTPKKGIIEIAYVSPEMKYGFSNNFIVMSSTLDAPMTSKKYSQLNQLQTTRNYLEYSKLTDEDMTFTDSEVTRVYTFEARYNETSPRMRFVQTARVCSGTVYLMHLALSLDKDPTIYIPLLQTFVCK